mgnify:CR=1 FL=1
MYWLTDPRNPPETHLPPSKPACTDCPAQDLEVFFTSRDQQTVLCETCFAIRQSKMKAKKVPIC